METLKPIIQTEEPDKYGRTVKVGIQGGQNTCYFQLMSIEETEHLRDELNQNWEVLAEPIQTVMRRYGIEKPYEKLKELTRGKRVDEKAMREFIEKLDIPADEKARLQQLTPATYIGAAIELVEKL